MKKTVYVISGPAGVGKSTTSRKLVEALDRSAYLSGDDISHIPVNGRGKPWLDPKTNELTWKNIRCLTRNLLDDDYHVVIDYVAFPKEVYWLSEQLKDGDIRIVYVVLLVDQETIVTRDRLRPETEQMGERSLILLDEFERDSELPQSNKLYTQTYTVEQLPTILAAIMTNDQYRIR